MSPSKYQVFFENLFGKSVLFATEEIGGFNQLQSWAALISGDAFFWQIGASRKVDVTSKFQVIDIDQIEDVLKKVNSVIVAGGVANRESQTNFLVQLAAKKLKPCFVYLDSWINFEGRLSSFKEAHYLVSDEYAYRYALNILGDFTKITQLIDYEFLLFEEEYRINALARDILLLETRPDSFSINGIGSHPSSCFCSVVNRLLLKYPQDLIIFRRHSSVPNSDCHVYLCKIERVVFSDKGSLIDDLKSARLAIGFHSRSLYIAKALGMECYSLSLVNNLWHGPDFQLLKFID